MAPVFTPETPEMLEPGRGGGGGGGKSKQCPAVVPTFPPNLEPDV